MTCERIAVSVLAVLLGSLVAETLDAQQVPADDEPRATIREDIVVSANRQASRAETVGSSVTVLTAEEIERRHKLTVGELLRTVPGVAVVRGGGPGQLTNVFIRGGNSSHTLVLLDGIRLNSSTTGAFDFAELTTDNIERIEILRGPQSSLYGSEALAGVISITTKKGTSGLRLSGLVEAGNSDHRRGQIYLAGSDDSIDYTVAAAVQENDGVSAASEAAGNREVDPWQNTTFSSRLGFAFAGDGRADLSLRYFKGDTDLDGFAFGVGPVDDLNSRQEREGMVASLSLAKTFGRFTEKLQLSFADDELVGADPDDVFSNFEVDSRQVEVTLQSDVQLSEQNVLTIGLASQTRDGAALGNFDESVDIQSAFLQNVWSWNERFYLTIGARFDDHSQFGDETTWRLTAVREFPDAGTRLHGSYGTGFKAPTLNDLYFPFFSNPDLRPETSKGFDVGVEQTLLDERLVIDLTYFDSDFEDLIVFDFATFLPQNLSQAEATGIELSLDVRPGPRWHLAMSHTYNDTQERASGQQLARRPKNRSTLSLFFHPWERLRGHLAIIAASDRIDSDGSDLDDYERVDLTVEYLVSDRFEPYLRVENLFDEEYEEINGFTTPGLEAALGLSFAF